MKTNTSARRIRKIRVILGCLAIAALTTFNLGAGYYCFSNFTQISVPSTNTQPGWNVNLSLADVVWSAH